MAKKQDVIPTKKQLVRQITDDLGIDVISIYDWSFKNSQTDIYLTFQWYEDIHEETGTLYFVDDSAQWIEKNREIALAVQKNRNAAVASLILNAYYTKKALRVAILDGVTVMVGLREKSEARLRQLDSQSWFPHHRNELGQIVVYRDKQQPDDFDARDDDLRRAIRHLVPEPEAPELVETSRTAIFQRDTSQVRAVKQRANGVCERCGQEGFKTLQGLYLEAHHVIPLNCGGDDFAWNMVAICSNDHREAHYGVDRDTVRDWYITDVIGKHFPDDEDLINRLSMKSWEIKRRPEMYAKKLEDWVKD